MEDTMPMKKIAISLPEPVLDTVDQIAARRGESRSRVIADILSRVTRAKRDRDITAQIDALFTDEALVAEQKHTTDEGSVWQVVEKARASAGQFTSCVNPLCRLPLAYGRRRGHLLPPIEAPQPNLAAAQQAKQQQYDRVFVG